MLQHRADPAARGRFPGLVYAVRFVFVVAGLAFKLGAAPFHMWVPDVYHGAPTAVTLMIGGAPKLAAFAIVVVVALLFLQAPHGGAFYWSDAPRHALNGVFDLMMEAVEGEVQSDRDSRADIDAAAIPDLGNRLLDRPFDQRKADQQLVRNRVQPDAEPDQSRRPDRKVRAFRVLRHLKTTAHG